ncbi:MAG: cyclic nucleotide-binding domain-containing protein, partial [Bacilli bacterium]|nr:cyclic nucleotide-binding domain-containing protein [Bacilli bacterium]
MHSLYQSIKIDPSTYHVIKEYKKNEMIFNEGDLCRSIGLIVKGSVKITTYTICDQEYIIALLTKDELFGE